MLVDLKRNPCLPEYAYFIYIEYESSIIKYNQLSLFHLKDGDFLVRESQGSPGQYVLTGMNNGTPKHLLLIDPEGVVSIAKQHSKHIRITISIICFDKILINIKFK